MKLPIVSRKKYEELRSELDMSQLEKEKLQKNQEKLKTKIETYQKILDKLISKLKLRIPEYPTLNPRHHQILQVLKTGGQATPKEVASILDKKAKYVSFDLKKLYDQGFVERKQEGRTYVYSVKKEKITSKLQV